MPPRPPLKTAIVNYFILHTAAIKRCYENLRRTYNEEKKDSEYTESQARRRKYRFQATKGDDLMVICVICTDVWLYSTVV